MNQHLTDRRDPAHQQYFVRELNHYHHYEFGKDGLLHCFPFLLGNEPEFLEGMMENVFSPTSRRNAGDDPSIDGDCRTVFRHHKSNPKAACIVVEDMHMTSLSPTLPLYMKAHVPQLLRSADTWMQELRKKKEHQSMRLVFQKTVNFRNTIKSPSVAGTPNYLAQSVQSNTTKSPDWRDLATSVKNMFDVAHSAI